MTLCHAQIWCITNQQLKPLHEYTSNFFCSIYPPINIHLDDFKPILLSSLVCPCIKHKHITQNHPFSFMSLKPIFSTWSMLVWRPCTMIKHGEIQTSSNFYSELMPLTSTFSRQLSVLQNLTAINHSAWLYSAWLIPRHTIMISTVHFQPKHGTFSQKIESNI